jgi:hypothetical protein
MNLGRPDGERWFGEVQTLRGVLLRVASAAYRGARRIDLREWCELRPGDPDTAVPTKRGVVVATRHLPRLLALLHAAARDAISRGDVKADAFTAAGVVVAPPQASESTVQHEAEKILEQHGSRKTTVDHETPKRVSRP